MNYQALNNTIKKMHERLLMKKTAVGLRLLYYAEPLTSSHRQKKMQLILNSLRYPACFSRPVVDPSPSMSCLSATQLN